MIKQERKGETLKKFRMNEITKHEIHRRQGKWKERETIVNLQKIILIHVHVCYRCIKVVEPLCRNSSALCIKNAQNKEN
jgi:hypothetical protein